MNKKEEFQKCFPEPQGLYHPQNEHDACGVGFICNLHGKNRTTLFIMRSKFWSASPIAAPADATR
jgi:hypothetical protein